MLFSQDDERYMSHALALANEAEQAGEVPVGAVVVTNGEIVGEGYNRCITLSDPTAHAEIVALRMAANKLGNYRLIDADLYVTLEPCAMCAGAMVHARIAKLFYGATDPRTGAAKSVFNILNSEKLNHQVQCQGGLLEEQSSNLLKNFFKSRR